MKKCLLALLFVICFAPAFSQVYNANFAAGDPVFHRPDEGTPPVLPLSVTGTAVHYAAYSFIVPTGGGSVTISSNSVWDNFGVLYSGTFDPLLPLTNAVTANDDNGSPNFGFTRDYTAGTYTIVICSFKNGVIGNYQLTVSPVTALPLKLISFTATKASPKTNILKWVSEEESNLASYQVQRSTDDNNYIDLATGNIAAKNNSAKTSYSFTDINPAAGNNFYRLKITEKTGLVTYSLVELVKNSNSGSTSMSVFPNPATDYVKIESKSAQNTKASISVISSGGLSIINGQYTFNNLGIVTIDVKKLPVGKYFIKTTIDKQVSTISFIKN